MAPSERTSTNNTSKTTRRTTRRTTKTKTTRRTRQQSRKEENDTKSKQLECFSTQDLEISEVIDVSNINNSSGSCCSTPKGKKFKIPEISTCPPAPKKQRVLSNFSLRRSPLSFFVPPDLEHFFMVAST